MRVQFLFFIILLVSNWVHAQINQLDLTFNPIGFIFLIDEEAIHLDVSLEAQISQDFGIMLSVVSSPLPLNNSFDDPFFVPYTSNNSMLILQGNYFLRPKRELDRWYISSMIGRESGRGDFVRFNITSFAQETANGKQTRYHVGMGLGYKRIFSRVVLSFGAIVTQEFANHYSQSLLNVFPDLKKETIYSRGVRFTFGIGYRFKWNKSILIKENQI